MRKISRQIGWSNESNLLYQILNQIIKLTSVVFALKPVYKVYSALLSQQLDGTVTIISEFDSTVGIPDFSGSTLGEINILFSDITSYSSVLGYCYSGGDAEDSFNPWLVKSTSPPQLTLTSVNALIAGQLIIRVDLKILV